MQVGPCPCAHHGQDFSSSMARLSLLSAPHIAKFMGPTWGPTGPHVGPMNLLSGTICILALPRVVGAFGRGEMGVPDVSVEIAGLAEACAADCTYMLPLPQVHFTEMTAYVPERLVTRWARSVIWAWQRDLKIQAVNIMFRRSCF